MDYTARYGLEFNPFLKNSKEVLIETQEYKEVLFRLNYLLTTKGFGLLTGSAGRGKTTAVRNWVSGLNTSLYKVVYSSLSTLTVNDFYRHLAAELGPSLPSGKQITSRSSRKKSTGSLWKRGRLPSSSLMKQTISEMPS